VDQKTNNKNHGFMLPPSLKMTVDFLEIQLATSKNQQLIIDKLFCELTCPSSLLKNM
jgi:hypothetical protein